MKNYYERAVELEEETIGHRRYLHCHGETGMDLPETRSYIIKVLKEYGLSPEPCGYGVRATIGQGEKLFLLRGDMDALPMKEESGLSFASEKPDAAHTCGHDFHSAMLLTAAKMLKEEEASLKGRVQFMFQPGEEVFEGAKDMIEHGLFQPSRPDAALGVHILAGKVTPGCIYYNNQGAMMYSGDVFRIRIQGKGAHGATPNLAIDPIAIGVQIHLALSEMMSHEADPRKSSVLSIGRFEAGQAPNIIPDTAVLEGTLRTTEEKEREKLLRRLEEICTLTAQRYGGTANVEMISQVPSLTCNPELTNQTVQYIRELSLPDFREVPNATGNASDDFAFVTEALPSSYIHLAAGFEDERGNYTVHHPKVIFNEKIAPIGSAILAHCAFRWLEDQSKDRIE